MSSRKRKRTGPGTDSNKKILYETEPKSSTNGIGELISGRRSIQIITGSYDKVLHGLIATLPSNVGSEVLLSDQIDFSDNFLFNAHSSAIRTLAISPPPTHKGEYTNEKLILASGSTDERINLYHISGSLPDEPIKKLSNFPPLRSPNSQNPKNKELGSLLHHASSVNVLHFPSRSKLLSAADDNTIAISRTRDWTVLSTIKAPVPRTAGRPSGDTTLPGGTPSGVNDFAVHPSQKLMISVGKGERCMRLWNLVTGKKAGVLNFEKELLRSIGESKWSRGEGRKVRWSPSGDEFAILFDKGAVIFGMVWSSPFSQALSRADLSIELGTERDHRPGSANEATSASLSRMSPARRRDPGIHSNLFRGWENINLFEPNRRHRKGRDRG